MNIDPSSPEAGPPEPRQRLAQGQREPGVGQFAGGCAVPILLPLLCFLLATGITDPQTRGKFGFVFLISILGPPLLGIILALIQPTRKFGLGMLIGSVVSWLLFLAICGYELKYHFINN
jgi:hypothetical protein